MKYYELTDGYGTVLLLIKTDMRRELLIKKWTKFYEDDDYKSDEDFIELLKKEGRNIERIVFENSIIPN